MTLWRESFKAKAKKPAQDNKNRFRKPSGSGSFYDGGCFIKRAMKAMQKSAKAIQKNPLLFKIGCAKMRVQSAAEKRCG